MENIVALTPNKKLIRLKTDTYILTRLVFNTFGMLCEFHMGDTRYLFIDKNSYLKGDQEKNDLVVGFVQYDRYTQYSGSEQDYYNYKYITDLQFWFDSNFQEAKVGDLFSIEKLETSPDHDKTDGYTKYFIRFKCEFKITDLRIDFSDSAKYPPVNTDVNSPNYCIKTFDDKTEQLNGKNESNFFKKNLGSKISSLPSTVDDSSKKILYIGMVRICWRIKSIYKDVLEKLAIKPISELHNIVKQTIPGNTDIRTYIDTLPNLSGIDKVIARLLVDWGYRDYDNALELFPIVENDQFYGGYYTPFENYYNALISIYVSVAYNKKEEDMFGLALAPPNPSDWTPEFTKKQSNLRLQYLVSIIPDDAVNFLDLDTKIKILRDFAGNSIYESREDTVIKIVKSIQINDALQFLFRLQSESFVESGKTVSLLELLYKKINDRIFLFGKNNRREFMNRLYSLWYVSALNPYNSQDLSLTNNDPATTRNYYNTFYNNKPLVLNYDSKKYFGFFVDNMNFDFNTKSITVFEEKIVGYRTDRSGEVVPEKDFVNIGNYDFYTAISLKEYKEDDIAVKLPAISLEGTANDKRHIIPLFYLKYMDDFGDNEDMWTALGLSIDVALTFTGIGNLSKLRHFRHLTKLGRLAIGEVLPASERILVLEALSGTAAFVELTSSIASIILQYYTNGCKNYISAVKVNVNDSSENGQVPSNPQYEFCRTLDQVLFWAQLASAGTDFISGYMLRKSARKLKQVGIPDDFPPAGKKFIDDIADMDTAVLNFLNSIQHTHPNIYNKVSKFANDEDKIAFMFDFEKYPTILKELNLEDDLIDIWRDIKDSVKPYRKLTKVLRARKFLNSAINHNFNIHIFQGEVKFFSTNMTTGGLHHMFGVGVTQNSFGKIVNIISKDYRGYAKTHAEIFHNGSFYKKGRYNNNVFQEYIDNDMFRQDWDKEELLDNIALAYSTKYFVSKNKYIGQMSDAKQITICIKGGNSNSNVDYVNEIITAWPNN
ncbi:MAG: hypothetical protein BGO86_03540 [Chryseobacterium sp. 36-9]|nr:MAG: hypothetical protein BGO86_03540 [Chryseobacterium sp. 36-9]